MQHNRIDPLKYPLKNGESWWVVHPNDSRCKFKLPSGAITVCQQELECFVPNTAYRVVSSDNHNGWVTVEGEGNLYDMPQYLFARCFDAEAYVIGTVTPEELENAIPTKIERVETNFKDNHGNQNENPFRHKPPYYKVGN
jgi:hypothetical protein